MKPPGGAKPESTPSAPPGRFGPRHTRFGRLLKPRTLISRRPREQRPRIHHPFRGCPRHPEIAKRSQLSRLAPMTSFRQIEANRRNACKSTGPITEEGKQRSRCNAVRHGLTAETVIGALEDAEDYKAFEAAIIADYDAQSAVERELVLRLASLLWRLRRATTMETGLFEIQADHLREFRQGRQVSQSRRKLSMQGSGGLIRSMPTRIRHRTASRTEQKPDPTLGRNPLIPPPTSRVAFCVSPICPTPARPP